MSGYSVSYGGYVSFLSGQGILALTVLGLLESKSFNDWSNNEDEDCWFLPKADKLLPDWW